ncbi:unnamed protein product [Rotaria magnacalcarata]
MPDILRSITNLQPYQFLRFLDFISNSYKSNEIARNERTEEKKGESSKCAVNIGTDIKYQLLTTVKSNKLTKFSPASNLHIQSTMHYTHIPIIS